MSNILKASILFGFLQVITTIAVIILCLGGLTDRLLLSAAITSFITSTYFSHTLAKSIKPQRLGIGVGVSTSIISLVICVIVLSFIDVDPSRFSLNSILILMFIAFVACGIFVIIGGAVIGWVCQQYLNALSKPLTHHSSGTPNGAP